MPYRSFLHERVVTWEAFWGTIPLSVLTAIIFINPDQFNFRSSLLWTAIALISHASMAPFVHYLNKRFSGRVHLISAFVLGTIKGSVLNLIAPVFLVTDPLPIYFRALNSGLVFLYLFVLVSMVQGVWSKFEKNLRDFLVALVSNKSIAQLISSKNRDQIDDTPRQDAIAKLGTLLEDSLAAESDGLTLIQQAEAIDRVIAKNIRPNSSQRWKEAELIWPRIHPWRILRKSFTETRSPFFLLLLMITPLLLTGRSAYGSLSNSILLQLISLVIMYLLINLADWISIRLRRDTRFNNLLYIMFYVVVEGPIIGCISFVLKTDSDLTIIRMVWLQIGAIAAFIGFAACGTMVLSAYEERDKASEQLRSLLPEEKLREILNAGINSNAESEYAQYLHAEVQAQLTASKLLLLKAADSDFSSMSTETTRKVLERIEHLKLPYQKKNIRVPEFRLNELVQTWRGLTRIKMDIPPELSQTCRNGDVISQLIEESVINAIRHGKAKNVRVIVWIEEEICHIEVQDDGKLKSTKKRGLGTTFFEVFAPDWKLKSNENGTLATMTTPF
ncbi:HATPase_UhpB-NarQ-NarX-like domain containing protein [Candidatus Nanopelagicaceae bacterium]